MRVIILFFILSFSAKAFWLETKIGQNISQWRQNSLNGPGIELKFGPEIMNPIVFGPQLFYGFNTLVDNENGFNTDVHHLSFGPHITFNGAKYRFWASFTLKEEFITQNDLPTYGQLTYSGNAFKLGMGVNMSKHTGINIEIQRKNFSKVESSTLGEQSQLEFSALNYFLSMSILY
jgi:hypothetical protein